MNGENREFTGFVGWGPVVSPSEALLHEIASLRSRVWTAEGAARCAAARFDVFDSAATHWGFRDGRGDLVAACRASEHQRLADVPEALVFAGLIVNAPVVSINRLVVAARVRGHGLARRLDTVRLQWARARRAATIVVRTWPPRMKALATFGFVACGDNPVDMVEQCGCPPGSVRLILRLEGTE